MHSSAIVNFVLEIHFILDTVFCLCGKGKMVHKTVVELSKGFFPIEYFLQKLSAYHYLVYYKSIHFIFWAILWAPEIWGKETALNSSFHNFEMFNTQELFSASTSLAQNGMEFFSSECRMESHRDHSFFCTYLCWSCGESDPQKQSSIWRKRTVLAVPHWRCLFFPYSRESSALRVSTPLLTRSSANRVISLIPLNTDVFA